MQRLRWGGDKSSTPRRGRWSTEEIGRFKELYGLRDDAAVARELNRSVASVRNMARQVFDREPRAGPWTADETAQLRRYLGASPVETIARILARTKESISAKITALALEKRTGPWRQQEINDFRRLYGTRTDEDLAIIFGRRVEEIRKKARELCIAKDKAFLAFLRKKSGGREATRMPRWKPEELELLTKLYAQHSNLKIAQRLNRSVKSVVSKAHNMGLRKDPARLKEMGHQNVSLCYKRAT